MKQKSKAFVVWLTGLSGSGKTTIAEKLKSKLEGEKRLVYILDGDSIRKGLNADLSFTEEDRTENIRRAGEVCKILIDAGVTVIAAFISPFSEDRQGIRNLLADQYIEVFVNCSLETCIKRDPKGLYKKALLGELPNFTGIESSYEVPSNPDVTVDTEVNNADTCSLAIIRFIKHNKC